MTRNNSSKINHMVLNMPHGAVITSEWLHNHGVSSKLAWWYVQSNWLEKISDKAYKNPHDNITWVGIVNALQEQLKKPVHISGKSALALTGKSHYLPMGNQVYIEMSVEDNKSSLPMWLYSDYISKNKITIHKNQLIVSEFYKDYLINKEFDGLNILLSCAELAILEVLQLIPKKQDFVEAAQLMESLPYLRVNKVQHLLEQCNSIKAKRLFLYLATKYQHTWLKKLDITKINLGSGKRVIIQGGYFDKEFQISVPIMDGE